MEKQRIKMEKITENTQTNIIPEVNGPFKSRYERRHNKPNPPFGQSKNFHLSFTQDKRRIIKYKIQKQYIEQKDGSVKTVLHYLECDIAYGLNGNKKK